MQLDEAFFARDTLAVARELLGVHLHFDGCSARIVETEAYKDDAASHAVTRPNTGGLLRETYGHVYIYLVYGMYHCLNFTTERTGAGAVLIRAAEPLTGLEKMMARRPVRRPADLTNGPGKLFQALGLTADLHGEAIGRRLRLERPAEARSLEIGIGPRIGISRAADLPWRFFIKGNPFVSKT